MSRALVGWLAISLFLIQTTNARAEDYAAQFSPEVVIPASPLVPVSADVLAHDVSDAHNSIVATLLNDQKDDGRWEGAFETTPVSDALLLAYGRLLKMDTSGVREAALNSLSSQFISTKKSSGWPLYPGGPRNDMMTAQIVGALSYAQEGEYLQSHGLYRFHSLAKNEAKKISWLARMHLAPLGLIPTEAMPKPPMMILHLQNKTGFSWPKVGPTGRGILAYTLWVNLKSAIEKHQQREFVAKHREMISRTLHTIVATEGHDGTWYFLTETLLSLATLNIAEQAGAQAITDVPLRATIERAWQGLLGWRAKTESGTFSLQPMLGSVWDTALVSVALSEDMSGTNVSPWLLRSQYWLAKTQLNYPAGSPLAKENLTGGWSFHHQDTSYPDVDDTTAVLGSLMLIDQKTESPLDMRVFQNGLYYVLNHQNHDGGFAVFTQNVAQWPMKLASFFFHIETLYKDTSQSDITSRVVIMLNHLMKLDSLKHRRLGSYFKSSDVDAAAQKACGYVRASSENISGAPVRLWHGDWFRNYIYGTSFSVQALLRDVCHPSANEVDPYIKWFLKVQNTDGGWGEGNDTYASRHFSTGDSALETTEFALIPLMDYLISDKIPSHDPLRAKAYEAVQKGVQYLLAATQKGTDFKDSEYFAVIFKDQWYGRYDYVPTYGMLHVLNNWYLVNAAMKGEPIGTHL